ncbi:hypothetical protein [Klebsiella aerogenes]|uniref:hypothetical protein n=1 Tax=Klebsiella aerogenes TaxID=548 RepID=UPI0037927C66
MNMFESFISYIKDSKNIKPIIISLLTILPLTALCTYVIIDNIIIKEKVSRINELTYDKNYLTNQLATLQARLEKQVNNRSLYLGKNENLISTRIIQLILPMNSGHGTK